MTLAYTHVVNGVLMSVPEMPAWQCDICGYHEFDQHALRRLERLTEDESAEAGRGTPRHPANDSPEIRKP